MKRPIFGACLIFGASVLGLTGCHQAEHQASSQAPKPGDPTAWGDREVTRGDGDSGTNHGLAKSSRPTGAWSSEARAVEKSLGVGN